MAVYGQPNKWQCGPFALKHALLMLGRFAHEDELADLAGSSEHEGTDEMQLAAAAAEWGCRLEVVRRRQAEEARTEIERWLDRGIPVLVCLDQWDHWVTVAGRDGDRFVIFDSHFTEDVLRILHWDALARRLRYRETRWFGLRARDLYDLQPLVPAEAPTHRFHLTPAEVDRLQHSDVTFGKHWDRYVRGLLPLTARGSGDTPPLAAAIAERRDEVLAGALWAGVPREAAALELERLYLVADVYGWGRGRMSPERMVGRLVRLVIRFGGVAAPATQEERALA